MSVITPKDLAGKTFSSAFKGYNKTEVDEYVSKVTKNYSALYRKCAELEESLAVVTRRLESIAGDERRAKQALESAKEKSDCVIAEAYERADDILVSIKKSCDAILRDFRVKVEAQKDALAEMSARVEVFKRDIFSRYRTHIELLEQLTPQLDFGEDFDANEYVMRAINDLKHEITAEYDIVVGYDDDEGSSGFEGYAEEPDFDDMPTEEEIRSIIGVESYTQTPTEEQLSAFIHNLARKAVEEPPSAALPMPDGTAEEKKPADEAPQEKPAQAEAAEGAEAQPAEQSSEQQSGAVEGEQAPGKPTPSGAEGTVIIPSNRRSTRKKKKQRNHVLEMLREYEEADAQSVPKIEAQLMLNLDDVTESLIESPKK